MAVAILTTVRKPRPLREQQCPLWVKSGHVQCKRSCPLHIRKRTCAAQLAMSALGQKRTLRPIRSARRRGRAAARRD
jgi:hypothetical protein